MMVKSSVLGLMVAALAVHAAPSASQSKNSWAEGVMGRGPLSAGRPEDVGVVGGKLGQVESWMPGYLEGRYFPAAQVSYSRSGKIVKNDAYGYSYLYTDGNFTKAADPIQATTETIWDLASMSKLFTTTMAMTLYDKGYFDIEDTVASHIPEFAVNGKGNITIRMLLTHTSGKSALCSRLRRSYTYAFSIGFPPDYAMQDLGPNRATRLNNTLLGKLQNPPGRVYVYSDVNLITMGILIERWTGMRQDEYMQKVITGPLGLKDTMYNPLNHSMTLKPRIAATEFQGPPTNRGLVWGTVHDENAWFLDGVAGHAGVFSTAHDLAIFFEMYLRGGAYNGVRILKESTVQLMRVDYNWAFPGNHHGLGFEIDQQWYMDAFNSEQTLGHTGYTGTYVTMDFRNQAVSLLLTNRVHPTRTGPSTNPARRSASQTFASAIPLALPHLDSTYFSGFGNLLNRSMVASLPTNATSLSYFTWYNTEPDCDYGYVETSADNTTWVQATAPYTNYSAGWIEENIQVPAGAKWVRFRYSTDTTANGRGWYVDELTASTNNTHGKGKPSRLSVTLNGWEACHGKAC